MNDDKIVKKLLRKLKERYNPYTGSYEITDYFNSPALEPIKEKTPELGIDSPEQTPDDELPSWFLEDLEKQEEERDEEMHSAELRTGGFVPGAQVIIPMFGENITGTIRAINGNTVIVDTPNGIQDTETFTTDDILRPNGPRVLENGMPQEPHGVEPSEPDTPSDSQLMNEMTMLIETLGKNPRQAADIMRGEYDHMDGSYFDGLAQQYDILASDRRQRMNAADAMGLEEPTPPRRTIFNRPNRPLSEPAPTQPPGPSMSEPATFTPGADRKDETRRILEEEIDSGQKEFDMSTGAFEPISVIDPNADSSRPINLSGNTGSIEHDEGTTFVTNAPER